MLSGALQRDPLWDYCSTTLYIKKLLTYGFPYVTIFSYEDEFYGSLYANIVDRPICVGKWPCGQPGRKPINLVTFVALLIELEAQIL